MPEPFPPASADLEIAHLDAACIVVVKPSGLLSVPGRGVAMQDCLASRVALRFGDALVVHRLDMATSGLMLFARGVEAQRRLGRAFAERAVRKRYIAVVQGSLAQSEGEIDLPLIADWPNRPKQKVDIEHGKPSLTRYRVLARDRQAVTTRVALEPLTGRAHQLRVHLLALEHAHGVAPSLAQQLVVVAQAVAIHAFAHRAARLVHVLAIAKPASQSQRSDVAEAGG